jgi:hypothetical protein
MKTKDLLKNEIIVVDEGMDDEDELILSQN